MKLLLTSAGIKNDSIKAALVSLLGKPIKESNALCIPTAMYGHPWVGPGTKVWDFISGNEPRTPMAELGWKSVGVLELTALPSLARDFWMPKVREADVLLVAGGDAGYLAHWMRASGMMDLLPELNDTVWVGLSAGSMVMAPRIGDAFVGWTDPALGADAPRNDTTLGLVDFAIFPHLDHPDLPDNKLVNAKLWAAGMEIPFYVIDDETAINVVDGKVDVVSEGNWVRLS
ncbi:MAG: Type 1 glutamine amidotransferase-like domain-containing protein [Armatimonadota bacterium]